MTPTTYGTNDLAERVFRRMHYAQLPTHFGNDYNRMYARQTIPESDLANPAYQSAVEVPYRFANGTHRVSARATQ